MWDLIVSVPDHCLSFYFSNENISTERRFHKICLRKNRCGS